MHRSDIEFGVLAALIEQFEHQCLPRTIWLRERVNRGKTLHDNELDYLATIMREFNYMFLLVDQHPAYQHLLVQVVQLHKEVVSKALANEENSN